MSSVSDFECSAPQLLLLSADRVALGTSIAATGGALWKGVVKTPGQPDRVVVIRRALGASAGSVARRVAALLSLRRSCVGVVGVIDVTPSESHVVVEHKERDGTMLLLPQVRSNFFLILPRITTLRRLQRLDLSYSHDITDAGLDSVAALQQLRHLDFCCNDNITDAGIANLSSLKQLQYLHLSQCDSITGAGLAIVASSLQHLVLKQCVNITDAGLASIGSLLQLQHLDLRFNETLTDAGLVTVGSLQQLRYLSLGSCGTSQMRASSGLPCCTSFSTLTSRSRMQAL